VVQLSVKDRHLSAPPGSPAEGDRYIVAAGSTGAWAGHEGQIAYRSGGAWAFHAPREGWRAWADDENALLVFDGFAWVDFTAAITALQNLALLGVGTTADATNPFAAKLNKALWTAKTLAEGGDGDLRYTMNKEAAADVLSLLMQSGSSGRAEIGLIGSDDFGLKVSANGSSWVTAMSVDKDNGFVALSGGLAVDPTNFDFYVDDANGRVLIGTNVAKANVGQFSGTPMTPAFQKVATTQADASFGFILDNGNAAAAPTFVIAKGAVAGAAVADGGALGSLLLSGSDGTNYLAGVAIRSFVEATPGANSIAARLAFYTNGGAAGPAERLRIDKDGAISHRANAQVLFDANSHLRLRSYTIATLPSASAAAGQAIWCSDLGGGAGALHSDGTSWIRARESGSATVASDANFTLTPLTSAPTQRHSGTLTANRTITLSATNAYNGCRFTIVRTGGGAFNLTVGALRNLATGQWAIVEFDGGGWQLVAAGAL
jgi:hypothetical protein